MAEKSQDEDDDGIVLPVIGGAGVVVAATQGKSVQTATMVTAEGGGPLGGTAGAGGIPVDGLNTAAGASGSQLVLLGFASALLAAGSSF